MWGHRRFRGGVGFGAIPGQLDQAGKEGLEGCCGVPGGGGPHGHRSKVLAHPDAAVGDPDLGQEDPLEFP